MYRISGLFNKDATMVAPDTELPAGPMLNLGSTQELGYTPELRLIWHNYLPAVHYKKPPQQDHHRDHSPGWLWSASLTSLLITWRPRNLQLNRRRHINNVLKQQYHQITSDNSEHYNY